MKAIGTEAAHNPRKVLLRIFNASVLFAARENNIKEVHITSKMAKHLRYKSCPRYKTPCTRSPLMSSHHIGVRIHHHLINAALFLQAGNIAKKEHDARSKHKRLHRQHSGLSNYLFLRYAKRLRTTNDEEEVMKHIIVATRHVVIVENKNILDRRGHLFNN